MRGAQAGGRMVGMPRRSLLALCIVGVAGSADAGIFGVPTNLNAAGQVCTAVGTPAGCTAVSADPPGFFILTGTGDNANGDTVHQIRFFIEVTGAVLDLKVFDAGRSGVRDDSQGGTSTTFQLIRPDFTVQVTSGAFGADNAITENRLARLNPAGTFVAADAAASTHAVSPGLYEFRATINGGGTSLRQAFGIDIRDGSGNHYNVYTIGELTDPLDSAFVGGEWEPSDATPHANITQPMGFYPYVDRGCTVNASNHHMQTFIGPGAPTASLVDALGTSNTLSVSGTTAVNDVLTVESTVAVNQDATNYGMWALTNDTGSTQQNIVDWRFADYQGWGTAPGGTPGDPTSPIRMYLPNGYAPVVGNPNAVAPLEPILQAGYRVVSGPNPGEPGVPTRYELTASLFNPGPGAISNVILRVPLVAGAALVAGTAAASVDGVTAACAEVGGVPGPVAGAIQCTFVPAVALDSVASLVIQVDHTPAAVGLFDLTGPPTGALTSTVSATYTPTSSSVAFPRTQTAGPLCQLVGYATTRTDLSVQKTDAPDPVSAGANLTYTILVANDGTSAAPLAVLEDTVPLGTTFQSLSVPAGWTCGTTPPVGGTGPLSCTHPSFAASATSTFTLVVRADPTLAAGTIVTNTATVSSAAVESDTSDNSSTTTTTVQVSPDIAVTKSDSPDPVLAGADITYVITVTNNGPSQSGAISLTDTVPANTTFQAVSVPSGWACPTVPAIGGTGTVSCNGPGLAVGASARITLVLRVDAGVAAGTTITNSALGSTTGDAVGGNDTGTTTTTVAAPATSPRCATGEDGAGGTLSGVINTYYPGTATAAAGATSITLGASVGAATAISVGDLLLVIQMQDAAINSTNTDAYGDGVAGGVASGSTNLNNTGRFEYVIATNAVPAAGGVLNVASALTNTYTNAAASATQGQRRFQVVRIPQYTAATLSSTLTATPWNGTAGGILAFDVAGNLTLNTATVSVNGRGFRGGQARQLTGGAGGTGTDYRNLAANNFHGSKGEGIAGTPRYVWSSIAGAVDTGVDGYPNGSSARGAPGNAGGGGTDSNPAVNDENSGGGGGGNGGAGGRGGNAWNSADPIGGFGGAAFPGAGNRLVLGGGGGAGTRNNSTGLQSSGGAGGGIVMIRAGSTSGTATINADGETGLTPANDGGGGGGAGGSVVVLAQTGGLAGLTVNARGGRGTDAWPTQPPNGNPGERHGPGGGGGGGLVVVSSAPAAMTVTGGANGITTTVNDAFGAEPGAPGVTLIDAALNTTMPASCPVADLALTKSDSPDPVGLGQPLTYTIVATNSFLTATNVTVNDTLAASLAFVSVSSTRGTCSFASPTVTCSLGTLLNLESATVTIVVTPTATGAVGNTASATQTEVELTAANNTASATTTVVASADLSVAKSGAPDPVSAGQDVTFTITVQNAGPSAAVNATLSESVPANTTFRSLTIPAGFACSGVPAVGGTGAFTCTNASLAAGASATFTFVVRVGAGTAPGTVIANTATVSTTTADPDASDNSASAFVTVNPSVVLLTRATIRGLRVDRSGLVEFATGTQHGTWSFNLLGADDASGSQGLRLLNAEPVLAPVPDSRSPILYEVRTAPILSRYLFIEETERGGQRHLLGPFLVGDARLARVYDRVARRLAAAGATEAAAPGTLRAKLLAPTEERRRGRAVQDRAGRSGEARRLRGARREAPLGIKVDVSEAGLVRLTRAELEAEGLPNGLPLRRLRVTAQGARVPAEIVDAGTPAEALLFRAKALSTTYTGRNVYLLTWGGTPTLRVPLTIEEPPPGEGIVRVSKRLVYAAKAAGTDPWVWDALFSDGSMWPESSWDPTAGTFDLPGLLPAPAAVPFRLKLVGASAHRHVVDAWLNGQWLGQARFEGSSPAVLEGLTEGLLAAGNHLSLSYSAEDGSLDGVVLLAHLDLAAPIAPSDQAAVFELRPFSTELPALDRADYLIVTHGDFRAAADRLAVAKQAEGRRPVVVDVERAYDRFSTGVVEARAVRALIAGADARLRHVLLLGDDTYDPRQFSGLGEVSYVPSLYANDGAQGRVPSENLYADRDGDGRPDVAIGRLPARTPGEADALVAKVARQGRVLAAARGQVFAVDNPSPGGVSFRDEAEVVAAKFATQAPATWADVGQGIDVARSALMSGFARGASVVHYFGHGGPETWADELFLVVDDVDKLEGPGSVVLTWACQVQDYQYIFGRSVNESLFVKPEGGALAAFGPAGITDLAAQAAFYERLYVALARRGTSLGEAIREAKAAAMSEDPRVAPVVEGFNLLGDPALVLPSAPVRKAKR